MPDIEATEDAASAPLPDGPWLDRLNADYVAATQQDWPGDADGVTDAFRRCGIARLAPLDEGLAFEPAYYREAEPAWDTASDAACYRHWLMDGLARGQPPSSRAHLRQLGLELASYPAAFPWHYYARLRPQAGAHRWAALDDFCRTGFAELDGALCFDADAAGFLCALGRAYSTQRDDLAVRAYELALTLAPLPTLEQQHLADAYLRLKRWRPAMQLYAGIARAGAEDGWTIRNLTKAASRLLAWPDLLAVLDHVRPRQSADALWPGTVREAAAGLFQWRANHARARMAAEAHAAADTVLTETVAQVAALLDRLVQPAARAAPTRAAAPRRALLLANQDDPDSMRRYVVRVQDLLFAMGWRCDTVPFGAAGALVDGPWPWDAVILFRAPALPDVIAILVAARRHGVPTLFASDAALPPSAAAPPRSAFGGLLSAALYDDLRMAIALQRAAAGLCDVAIAPTDRLAASLAPLVRRHDAITLPAQPLADATPPAGAGDGRPRLLLHAESFCLLAGGPGSVGAGLLDLLRRWPEATLRISGPIHLDAAFDAAGDRVQPLGAEAEPAHWDAALAATDIALPLPCTDADSEYRALLLWADAARHAVPCALLAPDDWLDGIRHDGNALRASRIDTWLLAIDRLLREPALRARLGARARADAAARTDPQRACTALRDVLDGATTVSAHG